MDLESLNFTELRDAEIVARMRKSNYEKFKTLVRMHLSFELDLNTDEFDLPCHEIVYEDKGKLKKWNRLSKKHKHSVMAAALATGSGGCAAMGGTNKSTNIGYSQSGNGSPTEGLSQQIDPGFLFHLQELKEFLMLDKNLQQEGIFRKNGSASRQSELRSQIQNDRPLDLEAGDYSAHDCATVFKGYLAELHEPLLTDAHYPAHLQIAPLCLGINYYIADKFNQEKSAIVHSAERVKKELHVLNSIQLLLLLLPDENRQLLQHIIDMLNAVAKQRAINKMDADNLATLFAPHLICPRNLPPEALHYLAKKMSSIIAYMIIRGQDIFLVPAKLATDIRAYFLERKRKKTMSPEMALDESMSDISTVNTVYTFVDREKTAAAHSTNTTDTELAQLYAHIQSMPESSKKRRLIKQFNKQNGQGTPLQLQAMNRAKNSEIMRSSKSLSDSIKKHIFHKGIMSRTPKRPPMSEAALTTPNNPSMKLHKQRILFHSPTPQNFGNHSSTVTSSSSSSSVLTYTNVNPANRHSSYNIKSHPLQKCISSSSLLMSQQHEINARAVMIDHEESLSSTSTCCNTNMANIYHNISGEGISSNAKSISAPVSRQTSSDIQNHINTSMKLTSPSLLSSGLSSMTQNLEHNCCVTALTLISNSANNLITGGVGPDKKSVAWDDAHLHNENMYNPSTPLRAANVNDLKSRFKSEPNLSMSKSICDIPNSSTVHEHGVHEIITPIAKHLTGRFLTRKLMKGVSMGNLKFPFTTPESTKRLVRTVSSTLKRRSSDDSQIYQKAEGRLAAAVKSGNAPLLQDMDDDDDIIDEENFTGVECCSTTDADTDGEDDDDGDMLREDVSLGTSDTLNADGGRTSSSELRNCFVGGPSAYQQLLLQQSGLCHRNLDLVTSTPSLQLSRKSMSPITKSTQRMPKAMQESIMTPRSRKPVMVLASTIRSSDQNRIELTEFDEQGKRTVDEIEDTKCYDENDNDEGNEESTPDVSSLHTRGIDISTTTVTPKAEIINEDATSLGGYSDIFKRHHLLQANQNSIALGMNSDSDSQLSSQSNEPNDLNRHGRNIKDADVLTNHFKEYLLTRSVLTAPPEDTSFTSHSDDYNSSHEIEELEENQLSSSLLYCLDGNRPEPTNDSNITPTYDENDENTRNNKHTSGDCNEQSSLSTYKQASARGSGSGSSSSSENTRNGCNSTSNHTPIITNRLANNPFVILNNARKRAATQDLDKISSTLFNSHVESPISTRSSYQTGLTSLHSATIKKLSSSNSKRNIFQNITTNSSDSSSNKENCEQNESHVVTKKLLISEYHGETSF